MLFGESAPGTAGKEEFETAVKDALAATAPDAEIVSTHHRERPHRGPDRRRQRPPGQPRPQRRLRPERRGCARRRRRLQGRRQGVPCITEAGGNEEALAAVESGDIYAVVALQFAADMAQSFDALTAMIDDPEATGVQLTVPQEVVKADG